MRFASVDLLVERLRLAARRFPAVIVASLVTTIAAFLLIANTDQERNGRLLLAGMLGFPLLGALHLIAERRADSTSRIALPLVGLVVAGGIFAWSLGWPSDALPVRVLHWSLIFHLLAAVGWFIDGPERPAFWQFNRILFERFLVASLFAVVLAIGLAVALLAIDRLLGIDVDGDNYPRIFAVIAFVIHPWFFLAGVPVERDELDRSAVYPIGLKVFAQYILIPLVTVYLVILTAYLGRVIVTREWPSGWIGWLVSSVAVTGTLALLLVHPLRERAEGRWVNGYGRWFFVALLPSLAMLLMAVGKRIGQYGITEPRYALAVLGGWLTILAGYFAISRSRSIRVIPLSLVGVALAAAIGPWGMVPTARRSQVERYQRLVTAGRFGGADSAAAEDGRQLHDIARYLWRHHGPDGLARVATVPADSLRRWDDTDSIDVVTRVVERQGVPLRVARHRQLSIYLSTRQDQTAGEGVEIAPATVLYGARDLLSPFSLRYLADTIQFRPSRAAGELIAEVGGIAIRLSIGAVVDSLSRGYRADHPVLLSRPIVVTGPPLAGNRIRLLVNDASWSPSDTLARSVMGSIIVSPQ
jgi:hypothetical protein